MYVKDYLKRSGIQRSQRKPRRLDMVVKTLHRRSTSPVSTISPDVRHDVPSSRRPLTRVKEPMVPG